MKLNDIKISDFSTDIFKLAFLSKSYKLLPNMEGFIKNKNEMTLFKRDNMYYYHERYKKIKLFQLTPTEYDEYSKELKTKNLKFTKTKSISTILELNSDFFQLNGKKHEKIRRYKNMYSKKIPFKVQTEANSISEIKEFINKWKEIRKDSHFQFTTGYDFKFFDDTYNTYKDNFISLYFYHEDKMVGFTVLEKVNDSLYNLLFRKTATAYINSCLYVDYYSFDYIYQNNNNKDFFVNLGGDVSDKNLRYYKTNSFNVNYLELPMIDLKIFNENVEEKLIEDDKISSNVQPLF